MTLLPRWARLVVYALTAVAAAIAAFPLLWMLASALKSNGQIIDANSSLFPSHLEWDNIVKAWDAAPFARFFLNSAIFSIVTTIAQITTGMLAGYAFAMFDFPGRRILFYIVISGLMIPFTVVLLPVVQILADVHWLNTYQGLIVPNLASGLGAVLFRQFFLGVPDEIGNAARVDGASEWRIFVSVYRPLAQPMVAAFAIIAFLQNWNNFLFPLVVTTSDNLMMVSQGLTIFEANINRIEYNLLMAGSLIAVLPILVVALFAQRKIVDGLTLGAVR
jgi:ABC-type glycerol-3-phosphate transport system permease component